MKNDMMMMNETILKGKWHQAKGAIKERWGELTDDDMKVFLGEGEQLVGRLQERYGYTRARAEREVADFLASFKDEPPLMEFRDKSVETVREHPWFSGLFFASIVLLLTGYMMNRFFVSDVNRERAKDVDSAPA